MAKKFLKNPIQSRRWKTNVEILRWLKKLLLILFPGHFCSLGQSVVPVVKLILLTSLLIDVLNVCHSHIL